MNKGLLIRQIRWLFREYDKQFRLARKGAKEQPVHDLRVMIKRINSLFLFLDETDIYRKRSNTYLKQLKSFFKTAGYLRDIQVIRSLLGYYKEKVNYDISEYGNYLAGKEASAWDSFFHSSEKYPVQKQKEVINAIIESVRKLSDESLSQKAYSFMIRRLNRIDDYLRSAGTSKYLHKIRQTLKQLRFFIEILQASSQLSLMEESDYNEIREIENIIGGWNDRSILINDIKYYIAYNQKLGSRSSWPELTALQDYIKKDRKELVKDIKPRLLKFIYRLKYSIL